MGVRYRGSDTSVLQNLLTSDGLNVMGLYNGQPQALLVRPTANTSIIPGEVVVGIDVFVPGFGWKSTGFAGHK